MKNNFCFKLSLIVLAFFAQANIYAQTSVSVTDNAVNIEEVTMKPDKMPEFKGGAASMAKFIQRNLVYPDGSKGEGIDGKVVVEFIVNKEGQVEKATVINNVNPELDAEALRVVEMMPLWIPGQKNGQNIPVKMVLPIQFKLD